MAGESFSEDKRMTQWFWRQLNYDNSYTRNPVIVKNFV
jgi:hypothetical protein